MQLEEREMYEMDPEGHTHCMHLDCTEDDHDRDFCCTCGHFHEPEVACSTPRGVPCGDYRCCVN